MLVAFSHGVIGSDNRGYCKQVEHLSSVSNTGQSAVDADVTVLAGSVCRRTVANVWPGFVGESERLLTRLTRGMAAEARPATGRKPTTTS